MSDWNTAAHIMWMPRTCNHKYNKYASNNNYNNYNSNSNSNSKPIIIAKKKQLSPMSYNHDISDKQNYLKQQPLNNPQIKLQNYQHRKHSRIINKFGLSNNTTQTRTPQRIARSNPNPNTQPQPRVLTGADIGTTKLAILDLCGDITDDELYLILKKQSKKYANPFRPMQSSSNHSLNQLNNEINMDTPNETSDIKTQINNIRPNNINNVPSNVILPTVQPKIKPLDSEALEKQQQQRQRKQTLQYKGEFVPHQNLSMSMCNNNNGYDRWNKYNHGNRYGNNSNNDSDYHQNNNTRHYNNNYYHQRSNRKY